MITAPTIVRRGAARIVVLAAALLPLCALAGCQAPTARVVGAAATDLSPSAVTLAFDVEVTNHFMVPLPLADLGWSIKGPSDATLLSAQANLSQEGSIAPESARTLRLPVTLDLAALAATVPAVRPGAVIPYSATLTFGTDVPGAGHQEWSATRSGEFPVPAPPTAVIRDVWLQPDGPGGVKGRFSLGVTNRNSFEVSLEHVDFSLRMDGQTLVDGGTDRAVTLPPGQETQVDVDVSFPRPDPTRVNIARMFASPEQAFVAAGSVRVGTRFGPVTLPFSTAP